MRKIFQTLILSNITAFGLFSAEHRNDPARPVLSQYSSSSYPRLANDQPKLNRSNQNFPFLSVGFIPISYLGYIDGYPVPGIGLSNRKEGRATDIYFRSFYFANTLSCTVSKVFYPTGINRGPYFSIGAGGFVGKIVDMPCGGVAVPLRAGFEGKKGFVDLGLELEGVNLLFPFWIPELRAGIQF